MKITELTQGQDITIIASMGAQASGASLMEGVARMMQE